LRNCAGRPRAGTSLFSVPAVAFMVASLAVLQAVPAATTASSNEDLATVTVVVSPCISSDTTTTFTADTPGVFHVTAIGNPAPTLTETGPLRIGVTFNAATGMLSGTPAASTGGLYPVTFKDANGVGQADTFSVTASGSPAPVLTEVGPPPGGVTFNPGVQAFTLTVNRAPAITSLNRATFQPGKSGTWTVTATGCPACAAWALPSTRPVFAWHARSEPPVALVRFQDAACRRQ